jgi:hypothetical protein
MENVYLWCVAVEGVRMAVVLGSKGLAGPGNTDTVTQGGGAPCLIS